MPCPATLKACPSIRDPESTNPARRVFPCRAVLRSHRPQNPYRIGQPHYVPVMWAGRGVSYPRLGRPAECLRGTPDAGQCSSAVLHTSRVPGEPHAAQDRDSVVTRRSRANLQ